MNTRGYTILEALIFLAVSAALFIAIAGMFNGRIAQAQFTNAVQELDAQIRSTMTETAAGYYPNQGNLTCTPTATYPNLGTGGSDTLGTNGDCVFIGKAFQFGVLGTGCTALGIGPQDMASAITNAASQWDLPSYAVGENGVTVCVGDGGDRKAAIIIGGTGHANSTEVLMNGGSC